MTTKVEQCSPASEEYARLLGLAALFDKDFLIDWIVELTGQKVSRVLFVLEKAAREKILAKEEIGTYCFSSPSERMRWQELIPPEVRRELHQKIAELLVNELPADGAKAQRIATHLLQIPNGLENCRLLIDAGDEYLKIFQTEEALQCYTKVLHDLPAVGGEDADLLFTHVSVKYSKLATARHDTRKVLSILDDAMVRAKKWDYRKYQALIEMHLAKNEWLCSNYPKALRHFQQGWSIAKELNDDKVLRSVKNFSTFFLYWQGRFCEAIDHYEKVIPDVERLPSGRFPLLAVVTGGICYAYIGQVTQGLGVLDAVHARCKQRGDAYLAAYASCAIGQVLLDVRRIGDAILYLERAVEEADRSHNDWVGIMGRLALSLACHLNRDNERSVAYLSEFLRGSSQVHMTLEAFSYLMDLSAAIELGELPRVEDLSLEREVQRMVMSGNVFTKGVAYRYQALLLKRRGEPHEKIADSLGLSLKWLAESGHLVELARSELELSKEYLSSGHESRSKESFLKASRILSTLGNFGEGLVPDELKFLTNERPHGENILREILKLGQEVVTIRENKELVQYIVSTVNRVTGAERGAIFLREDGASPLRLLLRASKNLTSEQVSSPDFSASMEMIEEVARTGKGRILGAGTTDEKGSNSRETIRSRICVPMVLRDKLTGVLYHDNRLLSSAFRESDLELLAYFAALAAFALDNATAYEEIRRLNQRLEEEKSYYQEQQLLAVPSDEIIGQSPAMRRVLSQMEQVARTDSTVLVLGETGVGKELVARAIHRLSPRCEKPFIRVNCNVLHESLIQSELFGHEKGAFTGAVQRRTGRFELADGGTLFLDEIGDLPFDVQVRLLNVLQSKEFERVGGSDIIRSDFRLVAATNRDLEHEVKEKRFRLDLYYRLNVFPIHVPPLRERKEDVPLLAHHFLKIHAAKMGKTFQAFRGPDIEKLVRYEWPGNVRELEHVIERGVILNRGPVFVVPDFEFKHAGNTLAKDEMSLEENERSHILLALGKTSWKVRGPGGAAEILNINPSTLLSRMRRLGVQRPQGAAKKRGYPSSSA
jgi:transcriptional regulator with GAF, ATPase, and Fis domain